jgi:2-iminobutanoate/2-iminopropanoate deaminase
MDQSDRRVIETSDAPSPVGAYSQAVEAAGVLYLSGQVPLDPATGELVDGGLPDQARRCLANLDAVARAAGASLQDAARLTVYLIDLGRFAEVNDVYAEFFEPPFPARVTVGVAALPAGAMVEIDATVPLSSTRP